MSAVEPIESWRRIQAVEPPQRPGRRRRPSEGEHEPAQDAGRDGGEQRHEEAAAPPHVDVRA